MEPTQIATATGSWLWEKFGQDIASKARGAIKEAWARRTWGDRETKYKRRLVEFYGTTKLLGYSKPINLEQIYTDVFVIDRQSAFRRLAMEEIEREGLDTNGARSRHSDHRIDLLDLARRESRLYILGKPGAGKSTFLKMVLVKCASGEIAKTPIFVSLKQWADSKLALMDFIIREFDVCEFPDAKAFIERLLERGAAVVLFDGLDEVNQGEGGRTQTITVLTTFARKYSASTIFVTCRIAANEYTFDQFVYVEIADFTHEQQRAFINRWYADDVATRDRFVAGFAHDENRGLRDLARTPLLLALLCLAFDETLEFPRRRVELYEEAVGALLKKWDASRAIVRDEIYRRLSSSRKEQLLSRIAAEYFLSGKIFFPKRVLVRMVDTYLRQLPQDEVTTEIDAENVVRSMEAQHGLLVERARGIYSFSHLTIQEYFTARFLVENASDGRLMQVARENASRDQWREVLLMAASMLDNASAFLKALEDNMAGHLSSMKNLAELLRSIDAESQRPQWTAPLSKPTRLRDSFTANEQILDLTFALAAQLHFIKGADAALRRCRALATMLESSAVNIGQGDRETRVHFIEYLRVAALLVECLGLAVVPDRQRYLSAILGQPTVS